VSKRAKKQQEVQVKAALAILIIPGVVLLLWFMFLIRNVPADRVIDASRFVVQIDSFLTAGFIVGVFWYWEALIKRLSEVKQSYSFFSSEIIVTLLSPFAGFALSSFLAIGGILTGSIEYLEWALYLTSYAVISVLVLLYQLHKGMGAVESAQTAQELQAGR